MKNFVAFMFAVLFPQSVCGSMIDFSSTGITTWPYNTVLSGSNTINVPNVPAGFYGTVSGNLGGYGSLTKTGSGTLVLSGGVTYTGSTAIQGGTLQINSAIPVVLHEINGAGDLTVSDGASLTATSIVANTLTIGAGSSITISESVPAGAATATPEPGTIAMLAAAGAFGGLFLLYRRLHRLH